MPKYRKKPVVIDAVQWTGANVNDIDAFAGMDNATFLPDGSLTIRTLEGPLAASTGDWIIRGIRGEFYPCKPDIFAATYEPVEAPAGIPNYPQDKRDCDPPIRCGALVNDEGKPDPRGRACDADRGHPEGKHHYPESPYELGYAGI